jgi:hypothetical protein
VALAAVDGVKPNVGVERPYGCLAALREALELAVVFYILGAVTDRETSLVIGILGLIYATIRGMGVGQGFAWMVFAEAIGKEFYGLRRLIGDENAKPPDDSPISPYVKVWISGLFVMLIYFLCLLHVFSKL